jgi:PPM family protein phosphatase
MSVYRASDAKRRTAISVAARTDAGVRREHNEDTFLVSDLVHGKRFGEQPARFALDPPFALALGVYDGAGGASSADAASRLAARTVHAGLVQGVPVSSDDLERRLVQAFTGAGRAVLENARRNAAHRGSATTATAAALCDERLLLAHVGDSRAYLLRCGTLTQVTRDQTLLQSLLDAGKLRPEEAAAFEHRQVLQALGHRERLQVAVSTLELRRGDVLLLCTDGLNDMVGDGVIRAALDAHEDPALACDALIDAARRAGGLDNVTALVARFGGSWLTAPESETPLEVVELSRFSYGPG